MENQSFRQSGSGKRRSLWMENASFVCGLIAVSCVCAVYPAFVAGSLGIVFALLSRGGEMTLTGKSRAGLIMGSVGLAIVLLLMTYVIIVAYVYFGGIEEMMEFMYERMELDYNRLMFETAKCSNVITSAVHR